MSTECVSLLTDDGFRFFAKKIKNRETIRTRECITDNKMSCPMFTILKRDFDKIIQKSCKKEFSNNVMPSIQSCFGLPKRWGTYTKIISFEVDKKHLYKPITVNGKIRAYKYKNINRLPINITMNSVKNNPDNKNFKNISQSLSHPFTGTGQTMVFEVSNRAIKKACAETGVSELVIDGNVKMKNIIIYDSYKKYCGL